MGQTISSPHPAVVLRSRYRQLRALLAVAMVAVVALAATVVILAADDDGAARTGSASQLTVPAPAEALRSDGGPEESATAVAVGSRDASAATGGPDESVVADAVSPD